MRSNLKQAREKRGLTQDQLAEKLCDLGYGVRRQTVSEWETANKTVRPCYIGPIRDILECQDPHLFDSDSLVESWTIKDIIDMLRRQFIEKLGAAFGLTPMLSNMTIALVTTPTVEPDEYLSLCRASIPTWWEWFYQGNNHQLKEVLSKNIPVLARLATTISPYQSQAARFGVEAMIMQLNIATSDTQFGETESCSIKAVEFGALSGDPNLLALAQYWHGDTFTYCYERPQTAIPLLNEALSNVDGNSSVATRIYSDLSLAHAQNHDETKALDSIEMAYSTLPSRPVQSPLYRYGIAELNQMEGKTYLYLAEHLNSRSYAQKAYDLLDKSAKQQAIYPIQALIRKADSLRVLGDKDECVKNLTNAYEKVWNILRLTQIDDVLHRVPDEWQTETAIQKLQKDISQALIVAHR